MRVCGVIFVIIIIFLKFLFYSKGTCLSSFTNLDVEGRERIKSLWWRNWTNVLWAS